MDSIQLSWIGKVKRLQDTWCNECLYTPVAVHRINHIQPDAAVFSSLCKLIGFLHDSVPYQENSGTVLSKKVFD